jgi:hypothetical protein
MRDMGCTGRRVLIDVSELLKVVIVFVTVGDASEASHNYKRFPRG